MTETALGHTSGLWGMIWGAGPMVKLVMLVLFVFSVVSWAIIAYKLRLLRKVEREGREYYDMFWDKRQFAQIHASGRGFSSTPLKSLFEAAHSEVACIKRGAEAKTEARLTREDVERIERILRKTASTEGAKLEHAVGFLATTGNTAPFIGLFGTVWGIMTSFRDIGAKGAANLAVVAPGISEALVATAMGLLAAIPAVVGYNHILTRIDRVTTEMESFSTDLVNIVDRQAAKKPQAE